VLVDSGRFDDVSLDGLSVMAADKVPPPQNISMALNGGFAVRLRQM
jgi:hypothetical protein